MLLGVTITPIMLVLGGGTTFALLAFQVLVGARKIAFKGPLHMKVHRRMAYTLLAIAAVHALSALTYVGII